MSTLFTKIVNGEIPCHNVLESDKFLAFLDIMPIKRGHVLVIPKLEVDYIFDLEDDLLGEMIIFSKKVAKKMQKVHQCNRIGITVIGLEVPHAHIHLVPIDKLDDMNFAKEKLKLSSDELAQIAKDIAEA
ncbi:MAG: HIT family protein [Crocinitomicaceae bacterium]|nr:HIT family protein [Crocinitomicaceae bacterium]